MVRVDLDLHTSASFDCRVEPHKVLQRCRALGLGPVAVTDHDTIDGALRLAATNPGRLVIGQEITTTHGELIGLFLRERVTSGLTVGEAAMRIKDQGGLVYLQHPYDAFRRHPREEQIEAISDLIDVVEVFNGRSDPAANRRAEELCEILGVVAGAGSDAHTLPELGCVYVEMGEFSGPKHFLRELRDARIVRRPSRLRLWAGAKMRSPVRRG